MLHLTVPPLVDACAVWLGIGEPLNFNSEVLNSACTDARSLGRLWVEVLPNHLGHGSEWQYCVTGNSRVIFLFFLHNSAFYSHCDKLFHINFMMYIVSYNSVQNGLFKCMYMFIHVCNMMYTRTRL